MEVQVEYGLSGIGTAIGDDAIGGKPLLLGKACGNFECARDEIGIVVIDIGNAGQDMLLRDDEKMYGSHRRNVEKSEILVIFIEFF